MHQQRQCLLVCLLLLCPMSVVSAADYLLDDAPASAFTASTPVLTVQTTPLTTYNRYLDGNWQSALMGSDGYFYFGASTHHWTHSSMMFRYRPTADGVLDPNRVDVLVANLSTATGTNDQTEVPQGKPHSQLVEMDGWIYGATHLANYEDPRPAQYSGSHIVGLNMANAGQVHDLGVTYGPSYTAYSAIGADTTRGYIYNLQTNWAGSGTYMVRQTVPTNHTSPVNHSDPNQWMAWQVSTSGSVAGFAGFVDSQGNMWFNHAVGHNDTAAMMRVDANGTLSFYDNALPMRRKATQDVQDTSSQTPSFRYWQWGEQVQGNPDKYIFTMSRDGGLWEFDAGKARDGDLSDAFRQINFLTSTGLGSCLAGNTMYFVDHTDANNPEVAKSRDLRLKSVDISVPFAPVKDWGRIVDAAGRTPYRIETIDADTQGHVFFTGDFRLLKDGFGRVLDSEKPFSTIRNRYGENDGLEVELWRGHFFGTVTVPEPATLALLAGGLAILLRRRRA